MLYQILVGVILIDQVSKWLASREGVVSLNTGVSFGWFQNLPIPLLIAVLGLVLGGGVWLAKNHFKDQPLALGLLIGGGLSNLLDRLLLGGVRDWLAIPGTRLYNNLADYAIGLAVVLLLWYAWKMPASKKI